MSAVSFVRVKSGALMDITLQFEVGLHVVVGAEHDGTLELLQLAAGWIRPRNGTVRVAGQNPHRSPEIRQRIATSLGVRFEETSVRQALARRQKWRSSAAPLEPTLAAAGIEALLARQTSSLTPSEHASLLLALALGEPEPAALLLHEPLDRGTLLDRTFVLAQLRRRAESTPVVCTTARPELVSEFGPTALWLEGGRLRRATSPSTAPAMRPGVPPTLVVSCSDAPKLARALSLSTAVQELRYQRDQGVVEVTGPELEALCLAVCRCAHDESIGLHQMAQAFPELSEVRAVHAALARTAYERAYGMLSARSAEAPR